MPNRPIRSLSALCAVLDPQRRRHQGRQASAAHNPALFIRFDPVAVAQQRGSLGPGRVPRAPGPPGTDRHERQRRRRRGQPNFRLSRYADDWCLMVHGTQSDAEALREQIAEVLSTMGLRLSPEKTLITHIEQGLDFLGWRIQRHRKPGADRHYVYTYPAKKSLQAIMDKVRRCAGKSARTSRSMPCCSGSTRRCGAGAPTSGPGCPPPPSPTCAITCGTRSGDGCGASTPRRAGRRSAPATAGADRGGPARNGSCSTPPR